MTSLSVLNPEITEVLDLRSGVHHSVHDVIGGTNEEVIPLRLAIKTAQKEGQPIYVCSMCNVPVSLLMHPDSRRFFFRHLVEDGRCSAITRGELSREEINARKYNGTKESARHIRMKEMVAASLRTDPRFFNIQIETRWESAITGQWRKPDVNATFDGRGTIDPTKIAFEIQLSTTYLDVIAERRLFYLQAGGLLFWIFAEFGEDGRRLTQDDVFYNNNQNAFIVDEDSTAASVELKEFHLTCIWAEPGSSQLQRKLVPFRELTLDPKNQQAFYYDYYSAEEALRRKIRDDAAHLRGRFEAAWIAWANDNEDIGKVWGSFYREFRAIGVPLPFYPKGIHALLLNALYSAKHGRVIGWNYNKFIEVAHRIAIGHKNYLRLFRHALEIYHREEQIIREDKSGKWADRARIYKKAIREGDPAYEPDTEHYEVLAFLFPELF
jgi:hypothetical protein